MTVLVFDGNDKDYQSWLRGNPIGYVLNTRRQPDPKYMVLHCAHCHSIRNYHLMTKLGAYTERSYIKVCSGNRADLSNWAKRHGRKDGSFSKECSFCHK